MAEEGPVVLTTADGDRIRSDDSGVGIDAGADVRARRAVGESNAIVRSRSAGVRDWRTRWAGHAGDGGGAMATGESYLGRRTVRGFLRGVGMGDDLFPGPRDVAAEARGDDA